MRWEPLSSGRTRRRDAGKPQPEFEVAPLAGVRGGPPEPPRPRSASHPTVRLWREASRRTTARSRIGWRHPFQINPYRHNVRRASRSKAVTGNEVTHLAPLVTLAMSLVTVALSACPSSAGAEVPSPRAETTARMSFVEHTSRPTFGRGAVRAITTPDRNATPTPEAQDDGVASALDLLAGATAALWLVGAYFGVRALIEHRRRAAPDRSRDLSSQQSVEPYEGFIEGVMGVCDRRRRRCGRPT